MVHCCNHVAVTWEQFVPLLLVSARLLQLSKCYLLFLAVRSHPQRGILFHSPLVLEVKTSLILHNRVTIPTIYSYDCVTIM